MSRSKGINKPQEFNDLVLRPQKFIPRL